jgi:hypothetical protein
MKKIVQFKKLQHMHDVLKLIKRTIDPEAFIAGGAAAEVYLGADFYNSDIDIFFKNPIFDLDGCCYNTLKSVLKGNDYSVYESKLEIYYYHYKIRRLATVFKEGFNFDFIQYISTVDKESILNSFDLDECKITIDTNHNNLIINPRSEFLEAWKTEEINPHYNMFKYEPVNEIQNAKTKERVEKWSKRKQEYFKNIL